MTRIRHESPREQAHRLLANLRHGWAQTCYLDPATTYPELIRQLKRLAAGHGCRVEAVPVGKEWLVQLTHQAQTTD